MTEPLTTVSIVAGVFGLLAYMVKLILPRLLNKLDEKDKELRELTASFLVAQNHKTTEMTTALIALKAASEKHAASVEAQTAVFKELIKTK